MWSRGIVCAGAGAGVAFGVVVHSGVGPLDPPQGPVDSTYKTLTEVEPRTPIDPSDSPVVISLRGSYYLTGNLFPVGFTDPVIRVVADDVTIDLNGFAIIGATEVSLATAGVEIEGDNVRVRNGTIRDCEGPGVLAGGNGGESYVLENLCIENNAGAGVSAIFNFVRMTDCTVRNNEGGIFGAVLLARNCLVANNDETGIFTIGGLVQSNVSIGHSGTNIDVGQGTAVDNDED